MYLFKEEFFFDSIWLLFVGCIMIDFFFVFFFLKKLFRWFLFCFWLLFVKFIFGSMVDLFLVVRGIMFLCWFFEVGGGVFNLFIIFVIWVILVGFKIEDGGVVGYCCWIVGWNFVLLLMLDIFSKEEGGVYNVCVFVGCIWFYGRERFDCGWCWILNGDSSELELFLLLGIGRDIVCWI